MHTKHRWHRIIREALISVAMLGLAGTATPASAYMLHKPTTCSPGQKWDVARPVKVRLLGDSVFDFFKQRGNAATLVDLARLNDDVKAVIALYNAIPGSRLVLEQDAGITGDSNLQAPDIDNFGTQTIVIGFTDEVAKGSPTAEAWMTANPADGCTNTRVHISFRKDFYWIFGPPDTFDVDGRSFNTAQQPRPANSAPVRTFLGILTHEMGHALGLAHPDDSYAVMAQSFRTWFRGTDHVLRTRLLPDDTAGILALYGTADFTPPLDISVSNSWFKSAAAQFNSCTTQIAAVNAAAKAVSEATGQPIDAQFPAGGIFKGEYADLFQALANAQDALRVCEDAKNAMQVDNCAVSSRADTWTDKLSGVGAFCGVRTANSSYPKVSDRVCPGKQVQLRYSLNNHTKLREVLVKTEAWFSRDTRLNAMDGSDLQSPDIREFTIKASSSANIGQVFRMPASAPDGQTMYVFVRALPFDPTTGASLFNTEADQWNNAVMVRHAIEVDSAMCPS